MAGQCPSVPIVRFLPWISLGPHRGHSRFPTIFFLFSLPTLFLCCCVVSGQKYRLASPPRVEGSAVSVREGSVTPDRAAACTGPPGRARMGPTLCRSVCSYHFALCVGRGCWTPILRSPREYFRPHTSELLTCSLRCAASLRGSNWGRPLLGLRCRVGSLLGPKSTPLSEY